MSNTPTHSVHSAIAAGPLLLLLLLFIGVMTPVSAFAVDGHGALGFRTISKECGPFLVGKYEAQDSSVAYCMDQERDWPTDPGNPWLTYTQGWAWLDNEFAAIICHGYPSSSSFNGHKLSPDRARAATQIAIWMLKGTTHTDGAFSYTTARGHTVSGNFTNIDSEVVAAARWLHDGAKSGALKAAPHRVRRYIGAVSGGNLRQDMLHVLPTVSVSFQKTSANATITSGNSSYRLDGAVFDIFEAASGARIGSIKMDGKGRARATLLPNTAYYLVEAKAPAGYVPRSDRIAFTTSSSGGNVVIEEQPGAISLSIVKFDAATGASPQIGASLAGAEFTCVSQSTPGWSRTVTTDEDGRAALDNIPLGTFTIYESVAPEGYLPCEDTWTYTVGPDQMNSTGIVELESLIPNTPIAFDIEVSKFKDSGNDDESGLEQPAEGVVFEVISNSSGQIVGKLTTNSHGFASTEDQGESWFGEGERPDGARGAIPYDRAGYTIHEVEDTVPEGFKRAGDWTISAEQITNGAKLQFIVDNHAISTHLQIVKRDARTGKAVPLAGFAFQLLNSEHKPVSQTCWYPSHSVMSTFVTDRTGSVTLPEPLNPGTYYIRETKAMAPYLNAENLELKIPANADLTPVAIASFYDHAATGRIEIVKTDAVDGRALAGAVFEIRAAEDIIGPDGSVEALAKETVATIKTDKTGEAYADQLPLGCGTAHYEVVETHSPEGYLLDSTPRPVELAYTDQETPVVCAQIDAVNEYTKVDLSKIDLTGKKEIEGARLVLLNADNEQIDAWTSTGTPHRIEHLKPGTYTLREIMSPRTYDLAEDVTFEIRETGKIQTAAIKDAPIEIKGSVDKRQEIAQPPTKGFTVNGDGKNRAVAQTDKNGSYTYTVDAKNESNTWVDEFTLTDALECAKAGTAQLASIETPIAVGDLNGLCNVWYRTTPTETLDTDEELNATLDDGHSNPWLQTDEAREHLGQDARLVDYEDWHLWKADVPTTESITLKVEDLNLPQSSVVTGVRFEYGAVSADFTTRYDEKSWQRDDLKSEHDDLDDATASLGPNVHGARIHMHATSSYNPQTAIVNSAHVDLCRNGGGDKLESHDEDRVVQLCARERDLPSTGSTPIAATLTALLTAGGAAIWMSCGRRMLKKH